MRAVGLLVLLVFLFALPAAGAGAAPQSRQSVSPIIGQWSEDGYAGPVLKVAWEPRGLHGPKTAEIYGDVLQDFRFWSDGCLHRAGERLFEVNSVSPWPNNFAGTGVVLNGDTASSSQCNPVGTKVTVSFNSFSTSTPPHYSFNICFTRAADGQTICSSSLTRDPLPGEKMSTGEGADYVAPGKYQGTAGPKLSFVVDADGTFTDPVGRRVANVSVTANAKCSTWSVPKKRWLPQGKRAIPVTVSVHGPAPIKAPEQVSMAVTLLTTNRTRDRIELNGSFTNWTHLSGKVRAVHYTSPTGRFPANPDQPGKLAVTRCDSGTVDFTAEHIPGSWQEIAGSRTG